MDAKLKRVKIINPAGGHLHVPEAEYDPATMTLWNEAAPQESSTTAGIPDIADEPRTVVPVKPKSVIPNPARACVPKPKGKARR
jgi:hypothetical protein